LKQFFVDPSIARICKERGMCEEREGENKRRKRKKEGGFVNIELILHFWRL
jgi:hypothetical protein